MKTIPFTKSQVEALTREHPTPFYIYDEAGIRAQTRALIDAFAWSSGFKQHFAVKALPNPEILRILREEGSGADCSSLPELMLADRAGIKGEDIMFSSNDTPVEEFFEAKKRGAIINLDALEHLAFLEEHAGLPAVISFRYAPLLSFGNAIIGDPKEGKFGLTREQLFIGYRRAKEKGVRRFGLHSMPVSNELRAELHLEAARELFAAARELQEKIGIRFEFINLGGGIGIPYRPEQKEFDLAAYASGVRELAREFFGESAPSFHMECGRYLTGPHGYLVASVRHLKETYKKYAGLDASMADLMRPAMYGAYHALSVLGKENAPANTTYDVTGSLCENNDKFAIDRELPELAPGDLLVIHDAGAHGHAMGFNYNGKLRHAEFLLCRAAASGEGGPFRMIRRAETPEDYFATLAF